MLASEPHPARTHLTRAGLAVVVVGLVFGVNHLQRPGEPLSFATPPPPQEPVNDAYAAYRAQHNIAPAEEGAHYEAYVDGTYTATGPYVVAGVSNEIEVTVTIENNVVTHLEVVEATDHATSRSYQVRFAAAIESEVVGRSVNELDVHRVAGASVTSKGFRRAMDAIREHSRTEDAAPVEV